MGNSSHCWLSVGEIKERIDKIDNTNKTLSTIVSEGDPGYSSFNAEIPVGDTRCEAVWTATYELVGDMAPPEHIKQMIVLVFKTLEQAVLSKKTMLHTEVDLAASPDAIWDVCKRTNELLPNMYRNSSLRPGFWRDMVKLGASVPSRSAQVRNFSLAGFSQIAFLHTNYARKTELSFQ